MILVFLAVYFFKNTSRESLSSRLYLQIIAALGITILTEVLSWMTDGSAER
ncbi:MAG: hypothetical protein P1P77_04965 [Spirochaetaceae bacterium]|nr:hypothetical protein [Spirochaetaceae bacterium]